MSRLWKRIEENTAQDRRWEVKVYAANGLMRAGAWSAAWNEMEKVDVEVSMYMPVDVRKEVEERCFHLGVEHDIEAEEIPEQQPTDEESRRREIYGSSGRVQQEDVDDMFRSAHFYEDGQPGPSAPQQPQFQRHPPGSVIELKQLLINYVQVLAQDRRNMIIAILSIAVLLFALSTSDSTAQRIEQQSLPTYLSSPTIQAVPNCTGSSTLSTSDGQPKIQPATEADSTSIESIQLTKPVTHMQATTGPSFSAQAASSETENENTSVRSDVLF